MKHASILILLLISVWNCKVNHLVESNTSYYRLAANEQSLRQLPADTSIQALISPYRQKLTSEMEEVIGHLPQTLTKQQPESSLGNWLADLLLTEANKATPQPIDFAVINYGGIRLPSLPKGDLNKGKIFELMPFDNMVAVVTMKGSLVNTFFDHMAQKGGWPISHTATYQLMDGKAVEAKIHQQSIKNDQLYRVVLSDYLANGGDQCAFLIGQPKEDLGILLRDMIIDHIQIQTNANNPIIGHIDGRITTDK